MKPDENAFMNLPNFVLDVDDIYCQRYAFSSLYYEAEKNNLDFVGFFARHLGSRVTKSGSTYGDRKRIITQPEISYLMYYPDSKGKIRRSGGVIVNIFIKTSVIQKAIRKIDDKNMNEFMICHEDFIIFFLLTRTATRVKYVDRLFYIWFHAWNPRDEKIKFRNAKKNENMKKIKRCFAYINIFEIMFKNTNNTFEDKKIAFLENI